MPSRNGLGDAANILEKTIHSIYDTRHVDLQVELLGYFAAIMGLGGVSVPWNRDLDYGTGNIDWIVRDPRSISFDPAVTQPDQLERGEYTILEDVFPLDLVRDWYPGRGALVKPEDRVSVFDLPDQRDAGGVKTAIQRFLSGKKGKESAVKRAILRVYWIRDRRKSPDQKGMIPLIHGVTDIRDNTDKAGLFPGLRQIIRAGNIILEDKAIEHWDGGYDLELMSNRVDLETPWALDEVQAIKRIQESFTRLGDAFTQNALRNSTARIVADMDALDPEQWKNISNKAGEIIQKRPQRDFTWMIPPALPDYVVTFMQTLIGWAQMKTGTAEIPAQKRLPSILTGPAITGLQLGIETLVRSSSRRLESMLQRIGQKLISRIFQYYTADRMLHLIGPGEQWDSFQFVRSQLLLNEKREPRSPQDVQKAFREFKFYIEPGSSLALTRVHRALMKAQLAQKKVLPWSEVLEELGFKNPEEKIKKAQLEFQSGLVQSADGKGQGGGGKVQVPGIGGNM